MARPPKRLPPRPTISVNLIWQSFEPGGILAGMDTIARKRLLDMDAEWELVKGLLPGGWQAQAKPLGAVRRLRGIDSVETLLRILLVHLADGCSLKETSLRVGQAGLGKISAVGIFKRLRAAGGWLAWMAAGLWGETREAARGRHCVAVDATTICEHGETGSMYRVHWCVNLANLRCEFMALTDVHGGEKFARFPIAPGDLILGDRGYSNANGVDYVRRNGGHVLMRAHPMSLPMYGRREGEKLKVLTELKGMKIGEVREFPAWVQGHEGRWHRGRLVAVKRSLAATRREIRRRRQAMTSRERKLSKHARRLASYLLVWTSLPTSEMGPRQVLRTYRLRWQLELVFKRAKSILGLGQLPKYSDASSQAWLNGKLLVALLVEKLWQHAEHFSPWGYDLPEPAEPLA
jgi:hypothetical protein